MGCWCCFALGCWCAIVSWVAGFEGFGFGWLAGWVCMAYIMLFLDFGVLVIALELRVFGLGYGVWVVGFERFRGYFVADRG